MPSRAARSSLRWGAALLTAAAALTLAAAAGEGAAAGGVGNAVGAGTEVTGTLVRAVDEGAGHALDGHGPAGHPSGGDTPGGHGAGALLAWVGEGAGAVRVPAEDVRELPTGATVRVRLGAELPDAADTADDPVEAGSEPVRDVLAAEVLDAGAAGGAASGDTAAAAAVPAARHEVTVVLAVPAGGQRDATTPAAVTDVVDGPVSAYWSGQTGGAVTFAAVSATDWVDLAAGCSDPRALWAEAAQRSGFVPGPNRHLLVHVGDRTGSAGCSAGLGTVGASPSDGGVSYTRSPTPSLIAHELGHNLGLLHSAELRCPGVVEAAQGCSTADYLDLYDVMGAAWSQQGSLSAPHAHRLGALDPAEGTEVAATGGSYALAPIATRGAVRALRLTDGARTYWVELRAPVGQDAWLATGANTLRLQAGVLVRREVPERTSWSHVLLDPTPSAPEGYDRDLASALAPGASTTVSEGRWRISTAPGTGDAVVVTVAPTAPGVTATPAAGLTGRADTAPPTPPVPPAPALPVTRRSGADRYGTAVAVSAAGHPAGAPAVVVASGEAFPDALAAGPVAARAGGPLLLVPRSGPVPEQVLAELRRLGPASITVAGGAGAVDEGVAAQLAAIAPLARTAGADRYETAARLAEATGARGGTVYLASGATHADAVAGAALAARGGGAVLLAERDALPAATAAALSALAPAQVVVLGGTASLGAGVEAGAATAAPGAAVVRLAGADRYDTAARVAATGYPDGAATVHLATGEAFPDALAGGPAAAAAPGPLLLTRGTCVPAVTLEAITALRAERLVVLGGTSAITADVEALRRC